MNRALCAMTLALAAAGCSNNIDTPEAVKKGVINDLSKRMDVNTMDVNVDSVSFRDQDADAVVSFSPKGGPRTQGMSMHYKLHRTGNEWHIVSRASGDMQHHQQAGPHGQANGALPPDHPAPGGGDGASNGQLPAGHPPVNPGQSQ